MVLAVVEARGRLKHFVVELAYRLFGEEGYWVEVGLSWSRRWARTLVLLEDGEPVGFNQVYVWPCCGTILGVHHYVAVDPSRWGRGYGKLLIAAGEEVMEEMGAELFAATLRADNKRSRGMLEAMGYTILSWREVEERYGPVCLDELMYVTGGYTDDLIALKAVGCPPPDPREKLLC
jgi:GNAT superfamily N-acetyltransferase